MSFKLKVEPKPGRDCKDFKPGLFDRGHCKLRFKCANAGSFMEGGYYNQYCDGILHGGLNVDEPPKGGTGVLSNKPGYGTKPKTKRQKPKPRPTKGG